MISFVIFLGRLGTGSSQTKLVPTKAVMPTGYTADQVTCGVDCSFVLAKEKIVLACGNNKYDDNLFL